MQPYSHLSVTANSVMVMAAFYEKLQCVNNAVQILQHCLHTELSCNVGHQGV